jgi:hypothetical protein
VTNRGLFIIDLSAQSSPPTSDFCGFATRRLEGIPELPARHRPASAARGSVRRGSEHPAWRRHVCVRT